jgi:hypothetical protein
MAESILINLNDTEPLKSSKKKPQKNNQTENNYET